MLMPSIFGENLFDDFFDDYFPFDTDKELHKAEKKLYGRRAGHVMKTDIKEKDNGYEFEIDLPGFAKDEVKVSLENGYMTRKKKKPENISVKNVMQVPAHVASMWERK